MIFFVWYCNVQSLIAFFLKIPIFSTRNQISQQPYMLLTCNLAIVRILWLSMSLQSRFYIILLKFIITANFAWKLGVSHQNYRMHDRGQNNIKNKKLKKKWLCSDIDNSYYVSLELDGSKKGNWYSQKTCSRRSIQIQYGRRYHGSRNGDVSFNICFRYNISWRLFW